MFRGTALWSAIVAAWQAGAALAGCSAGAMALADELPDLRNPDRGRRPGLALLPHLRVLPHFDRMLDWMPDVMSRPFFRPVPGISLIGIDEDTAIVGGLADFAVRGRQSAWLLNDGHREQFRPGTALRIPMNAARDLASIKEPEVERPRTDGL